MRLSRLVLIRVLSLAAGAVFSASLAANDIPGSAQLSPRATHSPEPPPLLNTKMAGANVGLWIREDGTVESAEYIKGTPEWKDAVLAAVKTWKFDPVLADGKAIPARVQVGFTQQPSKEIWVDYSPLPNLPGELHSTKEWGLVSPVPTNDPGVVFPVGVRGSRTPLEVALKFVIEADGTTGRFALTGASSEYAVRAALDLVNALRFEPAKIRDTAVPVEMEQKVTFIWTDELIPALDGAVDVSDPVFPHAWLLGPQEPGNATVKFKLAADGSVESTQLVGASHPDFGAALVAAVESWSFTPDPAALAREREYTHVFRLEDAPYGLRRFSAMARNGETVSNLARGMDDKLTPRSRGILAYPRGLFASAVEGSAKIEFLVDRNGLALMPRIVEATHPEFGWAAATWVNSWRFKPMTRGGNPAELRVVVPVRFNLSPPKQG